MSTLVVPVTPAELIPPTSIPPAPGIPDGELEIRPGDQLLGRRALANWLGISVGRLNRWAAQGYGPQRYRIGGYKVVYFWADALDFVRSHPADRFPDVRRKAQKSKTKTTSEV